MRCPVCGWTSEKSKRSTNQNGYYRGCVIPILANHLGYTEDQAHELMKYQFLSEISVKQTKNGEKKIVRIKSTTELNTAQFNDYVRKIREWAWEFDSISIPIPNEVLHAITN